MANGPGKQFFIDDRLHGESSVNSEKRIMVRTRTFAILDSKGIVGSLVLLHREHFTGKLIINMSQGSVHSVVAESNHPEKVLDKT